MNFLVIAWLILNGVATAQVEPVSANPVLTRVQEAESARVAMIERVSPSVVSIYDDGQQGGGSGVLIDEQGYGLTNYHVVAGMLDERRGWGGLSDGSLYRLEVLGIDPTGDVAMFRLAGRESFPFARLGDSDNVRVGDMVLAMGNPFSLSEDYAPTVTQGLVTGVHRYQWGVKGNLIYSDCIQTDASINPGNSGGPLFNGSGEIIGINGRISVNTRGRFNVGFGYAITSNQIERFVPSLRAGLLAKHGTLQAITEWDEQGKTVFSRLSKEGSAYQAGIRSGDRLVRVEDVVISSPNHYASVLGTYPTNWRIRVGVERAGTPLEFIARLDAITPKLSSSFVVDREANLREVERLLAALQRNRGNSSGPVLPTRVTWTVARRYMPAADGTTKQAEHFGASLTASASQAGDGPVRMQHRNQDDRLGRRQTSLRVIEYDYRHAVQRASPSEESFDLPADISMVYAALYIAQHRMTLPQEVLDLTGVSHGGGESAVRVNRVTGMAEHSERSSGMFEVLEWPVAEHAKARLVVDVGAGRVVYIDVRDIPSGARATIYLSDYREVGGRFRACTIEVVGASFSWRDTLTDWNVEQ